MKELPFNAKAWEVRAWQEGRKTQFRRVVKPGSILSESDGAKRRVLHLPCDYQVLSDFLSQRQKDPLKRFCKLGQPGGRLWCREVHSRVGCKTNCGHSGCHTIYRADEARAIGAYGAVKWTPLILMPRWASRITLEIVSVRVERLNEISAADAIAEGTPSSLLPIDVSRMPYPTTETQGRYAALWESINGPGSWDANPWVWVVETKVIT